jgi:uncharacterized membrane protein
MGWMTSRKSAARTTSAVALASLLAGSGLLHLLVPGPYRQIVPHALGHARELVAASAVAELACAVAILLPRTRRAGGWATAALFVAVFPANVQMALDGGISGAGFPLNSPVAAWLRLPLQVPLILWATNVARQGATGFSRSS